MSQSGIKDNCYRGKVGEFLKEAIKNDSMLSIVSAYFTIYAYHHLKDSLDNIKKLRFLFGEPTFINALDPSSTAPKEFRIEDSSISIANKMFQKKIALDCYKWIEEKAEIRSMTKPNFLHGKVYHIKQASGIEKALIGSSNFTSNGLGMGRSKNIELNMIIDSDRDRTDISNWFDTLWESDLVIDVKQEVLKYLKQLYRDNSPGFIYYKTLFHLFEDYLHDTEDDRSIADKTHFYDTEIWNALYNFQKDGVRGAINKILSHNGCIIADSVGLGKTYEALAVIKYFELLNYRVLVLCPKKLEKNWTIYQAVTNHRLNPFSKDRFHYAVKFHTDLSRIDTNRELSDINWSAYDLVVIDESHNFKGNPQIKQNEDGTIKHNRASFLLEEIIKSGIKTKVLMLSATPVNNTLKDLRNQITMITEGNTDALSNAGIDDINLTLKNAQYEFTNWAKKNIRNTRSLFDTLDSSFFKLLDELTISRSRKHIINNYDIKKYNSFPNRNKPISLSSKIDIKDEFPAYTEIEEQIMLFRLSLYNPTAYIKEDKKHLYTETIENNFKQADRETYLIGMMKINYLKRLESSIHSFRETLSRTIGKIDNMINRIDDFKKYKTKSSWTDNVYDEEDDEWFLETKLIFNMEHLDLESYLKDLHNDKQALKKIFDIAEIIDPSRDAKLLKLKSLIHEKTNNSNNKKILIFTAFADTAKYLYDNIKYEGYNTALITGTNNMSNVKINNFDEILLNFSPISKNRSGFNFKNHPPDIDILIATDCLSEGQNLQDCDYMINYDIHWNPVRIIQRFGRIDRLGSINKAVQMVNFWPTPDLESYIRLRQRVEARMALVDIATTGEDNLLSQDPSSIDFRNKQLKKLREEVLDLEDLDGSITLSDFTLESFRIELKNFIEKNKKTLSEAPLGLYAIAPSNENIQPGVIFCLSHRTNNKKLNPLDPYFLAYIREDGTLRYNFTHPKQILEIYKQLCHDKNKPDTRLCDLFNNSTNYQKDLSKYNDLLKRTAREIMHIYKKKNLKGLQKSRSAILTPQKDLINNLDDLELITWLIII